MEILKNTSLIGFCENDLIISQKVEDVNHLIRYNIDKGILWKCLYENNGNIFLKGNCIVVFVGKGSEYIDILSGKKTNSDRRYHFNIHHNYEVYFDLENPDILHIDDNEVVNFSRIKSLNTDEIFFTKYNGSYIKAINFYNNEQLFFFDTEDYFNAPSKILEGRVLVVEDRLVFFAHTEDWSKAATFVLDAQTGEVLFTTDQMGLKLYKYNKHIYQIQEKKIKKINPITTKIQTIELTEELAKRRLVLEDKSAWFYNNKLYTLAREENNDIYSIWVVINLDNGTIEYQYEMLFEPDKKATDKNKMFITDIQANDKMVAVLAGNNLHIFEREEKSKTV